jgi:hypothetical protein
MSASIHLDFHPHINDEDILVESAKYEFDELKNLYISPTIRLGNSGVRVYRGRAKDKNGSFFLKYYAKVGENKKIRNEFNAYKKFVQKKLKEAPKGWIVEGGEDACLGYYSVGLNPDIEPLPLENFLPFASSNIKVDKLCNAIIDVYETLKMAWGQPVEQKTISWFKDYDWYLRWSRTKKFLKGSWIEEKINEPTFNVGDMTLINPYAKILQIERDKHSSIVKYRTVHGDLHQKNIIIDIKGEELIPWIIDFARTRNFHSIVDYAFLEASLKIFHFSKYYSDMNYIKLHDNLHSEIEVAGPGFSPTDIEILKIIHKIRSYAKKEVLNDNAWPEEYYLSSLFVSMGLISIHTCPSWYAWLTSSWLATKLENIG